MTDKTKSVDIEQFMVPIEELCVAYDPTKLGFQTTEELEPYQGFIGQERAEKAMRRAFLMSDHGHNVFVIEPSGSGRSSSIRWYVKKIADEILSKHVVPADIRDECYVYNFEDPDAPRLIRLPKGKGGQFKNFIEGELIGGLREKIMSLLDFNSFPAETKEALNLALNAAENAQNNLREDTEKVLEEAGEVEGYVFRLVVIPQERGGGFGIYVYKLPENPDEKAQNLTSGEFASWPAEKRERFLKKQSEIFQKTALLDRRVPELWIAYHRLREDVTRQSVRSAFEEISGDFGQKFEGTERFLTGLKEYTVKNYHIFWPKSPNNQKGADNDNGQQVNAHERADPFLPFKINVFVDNSGTEGLPIISEDRPTYFNLFGKMERRGANIFRHEDPDHTDLRAGTISSANGGFLIINADDLFRAPGCWDGLKRVLLKEELNIEDLAEQWIIPLHGLKPKPIPTKLKVILVGESDLYHALIHHLGANFT